MDEHRWTEARDAEARIATMRAQVAAIEAERARAREEDLAGRGTWAVAREDRGWALGFTISTLAAVGLAAILAVGPATRAPARPLVPDCPRVALVAAPAQPVALPTPEARAPEAPTPAPRPRVPTPSRRPPTTEQTLQNLEACGNDPTCGLPGVR